MDFGADAPKPPKSDTGYYAGCSTEQLDYRRMHGSKRVTGVGHFQEFSPDCAGLTSARIAGKRQQASKRVVGLRSECQVQDLMWQQFAGAACEWKSVQTAADGPPVSPPVAASQSEDHACRPPPEPEMPVAAGVAGDRVTAVRQKMPLRRYGDPASAVNGFNTRWQPDPTSKNGKMGLFMQRNPGYANFETDVSRMDPTATYHRDKGYGSANRSYLCDQVTADRNHAYFQAHHDEHAENCADRPPPLA